MTEKILRSKLNKNSKIAIIGSSPQLLLTAISLSKQNYKYITIISPSTSWGGNWSLTSINSIGYIESSCHILESYKKTHDFLFDLGISIYPCKKECMPIKAYYNQKLNSVSIHSYHSRRSLLYDFAVTAYSSLHLSRLKTLIKKCLSRNNILEVMTTAMYSISIFLRYRFRQLLIKEPICFHEHGWSGFLIQLTDIINESFINVVDSKVASINQELNQIHLLLDDQSSLDFDFVLTGESLTNVIISGAGTEDDSKPLILSSSIRSHQHLLVKLDLSSIPPYDLLPTYIHLPKDKLIHRITPVSVCPEKYLYLLVQTRHRVDKMQSLSLRLRAVLSASIYFDKKSLIPYASMSFIHQFDVESHIHSPSLLTTSFNNILVLKTYGDLSYSISYNLHKYSFLYG